MTTWQLPFVKIRHESETIGNPATFSCGSRKKRNGNINTVIDGFQIFLYQRIFNFLQISEKTDRKNQEKSLASRSASRLVE